MAEVEKRISDGDGLLAKEGSSANMYSGDMREIILTISNLGSSRRNTMERTPINFGLFDSTKEPFEPKGKCKYEKDGPHKGTNQIRGKY